MAPTSIRRRLEHDGRGEGQRHLFDRALRATGSSIQEVMQQLYINFGLTGTQFTQAAVVGLPRQQLEDFFERHLKPAPF